jgi:predicted metalloprotease with PDZ domain
VREYERHVEGISAIAGGHPAAVTRTRKNRWRVATGGAASVTVRYRVYAREPSVRTNWVDSAFAMINGAPTFLSLVDSPARPHEVTIERPEAWREIRTALPPVDGAPGTFRADSYDTLVDSPIIIGNPVVRSFEVDGKPHYLVLEGAPQFFDADRAAADLQKIVTAAGKVMGPYLYPSYYFLNMVTGTGGGGIEHKNSFLVMADRFATRTHAGYQRWLGLVAHEYFHNWNVKRLRPAELGTFDYERENYVSTLWVAEGFTEYYGDLLVTRAGLSSEAEYLQALSGEIAAVQTTPGRLVTPVSQASYEAWIKEYRPDENTANSTISYYPKGAVIAFLLDAKIRAATHGARSLDDGMRLALQRYAGEKGYTADEFYAVMSEVAGIDLRPFFARAVDSTEELDYREALDYFGLRFRPASGGAAGASLGASTRNDAGRLVVSEIPRGSPALAAGMDVGDEILAMDDVRVRADGLAGRLAQYRPGDRVTVLVARRDVLMTLDVTLGAEPAAAWQLERLPTASAAQLAHLAAWLGK